MDNPDIKLEEVEKLHQEYLAELDKLEDEQREKIQEFLEQVRLKKIQEIKDSIK